MISRCSHFSDQPLAMKRAARSSSSSRVRRPVALRAEVARRVDQAGAEVVLPDAVDDHAGRQRRALGDDGVGQFEPAAALRERPRRVGRQHRQEAARHDRAGAGRVAAHLHGHVLGDAGLVVQLGPVRAVGAARTGSPPRRRAPAARRSAASSCGASRSAAAARRSACRRRPAAACWPAACRSALRSACDLLRAPAARGRPRSSGSRGRSAWRVLARTPARA